MTIVFTIGVPSSAAASSLLAPIQSILATVSSTTLAQAQAAAQQWWGEYSGTVYSILHSGSAAGKCTDFVSARRPDIISRVEQVADIEHFLANQTGPVLVNWLAKDWSANANAAGLKTGKKPRRGAVIVFQPGAYGAESGGHVAIVDHVNRNGSFTISEENAPVAGVMTRRHFSARTARAMSRDRRIVFIY